MRVVLLVAVAGLGLCAAAVAGFMDSYAHPSHVSLAYIPPQPPAEAAAGGVAAAGAAPVSQPAAAAAPSAPAPPPAAERSGLVAALPPPAPENGIRVVKRIPAEDHESKHHGHHD